MSAYLKALGFHVYLATTKKFYFDNDKYIEINAKVMEAFRHTLSKKYLSIISHCDFTFVAWNTLTSSKQQIINYVEKEPRRDESDQAYFMVQGIDSLEIF